MEKPNSVMSIVERLGNVFYWVGFIAAPLTYIHIYTEEMDKYTDSAEHEAGIAIYALFCAAGVWLAGLLIRYILSGRGLWQKR